VSPQTDASIYTVKSGYPPRPLTVVPELPLSSLGLQKGEQIIVNQKASTRGSGSQHTKPTIAPSKKAPVPVTSGSVDTASVLKKPSSAESGPDYVEVDGSVLVHRVRFDMSYPRISRITMHRLCQMIIPVYSPL
jgi:ubiquitin thioesterase OTU1